MSITELFAKSFRNEARLAGQTSKRTLKLILPLAVVLALVVSSLGLRPAQAAAPATTIGGISLGNLTDYLFFFADGSQDANWQGATKGFVGDVAVDGIQADERTSGGVPYAGTIYTNDSTLGAWQNIVNQNSGQAFASTGQTARIASLEADLNAAFAQINALSPTPGYASVSSTSLNGLNKQNGVAETFVINITSGLGFSSKINITGDASDVFSLNLLSSRLTFVIFPIGFSALYFFFTDYFYLEA